MASYRQYRPGEEAVGTIIVRLFEAGGELRGVVRRISAPDTEDHATEEMLPEKAFRVAESMRGENPEAEIVIEAVPGRPWSSD